MKKWCLIGFVVFGNVCYGKTINYEAKVFLYLSGSLERSDLFAETWDYVDTVYTTENKLMVYDLVYSKTGHTFLRLLFIEDELIFDTPLQFKKESSNILFLELDPRLQLTEDPTNFQKDTCVVRFSERLVYNGFIVVSF